MSAMTGWRWSTTASSKTTRSCAPGKRRPDTRSIHRRIPRSSFTRFTIVCRRRATCCGRCRIPCGILRGAYAIGVVSATEPGRLVAARRGSPLVVGIGVGEYFIASDVFALLPVTQRCIFLQEGDVADVRADGVSISEADGRAVARPESVSRLTAEAAEKSGYRHFMLKEIFTQPQAIAETLEGRVVDGRLAAGLFGENTEAIFPQVQSVQIVACGTSYHAGAIARYWFESLAGVPCSVEVASEFRYRETVVRPGTLFVAISQSGETADTLAALREARRRGYTHTLAICNVPESSLTREAGMVFLTRAGPEI